MRIQGVQKLTLLDYPGKVACTIFTAGCNFRCPYCHNASLVTRIDPQYDIPEEEVLAFLRKRQGVLEGVCISGGEPLLQPDLFDFIRKVKAMGYEIKLDTNGSDTVKLRQLVEAQLIDYVAMDIKNTPSKYGETIGMEDSSVEKCIGYRERKDNINHQQSHIDNNAKNHLENMLQNVKQSVAYLLSDAIPYEFRTTIIREFHKREDMPVMAQWIAGARKYYLQGFIDSGDLIGSGYRAYNKEIMEQALAVVKEFVPDAELRGVE